MKFNKEEHELIKALHKKRKLEPQVEREFEIFQQLLPAIRAAVKAGGGAESIMKKSGPLAAYRLVQLLASEKEEIAIKAAEKIVAYDVGKPVERSINVYGDISKMNENDVDSQILLLLEKTGAKKLLETTLQVPTRKRLQKRKPRNSDPLVIDAEVTTVTTSQTQESLPSAEARVAPESQDQGTPR